MDCKDYSVTKEILKVWVDGGIFRMCVAEVQHIN